MVFSCICSCESMRFQWIAPNSVSQACLLKLSQSQKCVLICSEMKPIINLYMQRALGGVGKGQTELGICARSISSRSGKKKSGVAKESQGKG